MIKTNSKQAITNIKNYILNNFIEDDGATDGTFKSIANYINNDFIRCAYNNEWQRRENRQQAFFEWGGGLPCGAVFDYFNDCNAVAILGDILEESEQERAKYSEDDAQKRLTYLLYREIMKVSNRY